MSSMKRRQKTGLKCVTQKLWSGTLICIYELDSNYVGFVDIDSNGMDNGWYSSAHFEQLNYSQKLLM